MVVSLVFAQAKPQWVTNHPLDSAYYIGIAFCEKSKPNYMECSKSIALESIASEIMIKVSSENQQYIKERNDFFESSFTSTIKTQTTNELEGYEVVDIWQDSRSYWVYYHLSKTKYASLLTEKVMSEYNISKQFLEDGLIHLNNKDFTSSLSSFLQANLLIQHNLSRPSVSDYTSKSWALYEQSKKQIIDLLSRIHLLTDQNEVQIAFYNPKKVTLKAQVVYKEFNGAQTIIPNMPIRFTFEKGSGILSDSIVYSSNHGLISNTLLKIKSPESKQSILCEVSIETLLLNPSKMEFLQSISKGNLSRVRFNINVEKAIININSIEQNLGIPITSKIIEPSLINFLKSNGFNITPNPKEAEYSISINANTRKGTQMNGICTSFLDIHITLNDNAGNMIYSNSKSGLKGLKLNYNEAGLDSYKRNIDVIEKDLFQIMLTKLLIE